MPFPNLPRAAAAGRDLVRGSTSQWPRMLTAADMPADARDMAIVHQFYRREFDLAPRILRDLWLGDTVRRAAVQEWFDVVLVAVHHHHVAEDRFIYPLLVGLVSDDLLDTMERQHEQVAEATDLVGARLKDWVGELPGARDALIEAYERLLPGLVRHLDDEEAEVVPLIDYHLTAGEYGEMHTSGNGLYQPHLLMMMFGAIVEQCSVADGDYMLSHLPPEAQRDWYDHVRHEYAAHMSLIRDGLVPLPGVSRSPLPPQLVD